MVKTCFFIISLLIISLNYDKSKLSKEYEIFFIFYYYAFYQDKEEA